jgi:hypothetical protein
MSETFNLNLLTGALSNEAAHMHFFYAEKPGELTLDFTHPSGSAQGEGIDVVIRDSAGHVVMSRTFHSSGKFDVTLAEAGEYAVTVSDADPMRHDGGVYSIAPTLRYDENTVYDGASNNDVFTALPLSLAATLSGTVSEGDHDLFRIDAPAGGVLALDLRHESLPQTGPNIRAVLRDADDNIIASHLVDNKVQMMTVPNAGVYYLDLGDASAGINDDGGFYRGSATFFSELHTTYDGGTNNLVATAMPTSLAVPIVGAIEANDSDYFVFDAPTGGQLNLNFVHPDGAGNSGGPIQVNVIDVATGKVLLHELLTGSAFLSQELVGGGSFAIDISSPHWSPMFKGIYGILPSVTNASGDDLLTGSESGDAFAPSAGNDTLNGLGGLDSAAYVGNLNDYKLVFSDAGVVVTGVMAAEGTDTLVSIERLNFADKTIDIGMQTSAAQVYRLYDAAFNRTSDEAGLGFWVHAAGEGLPLNAIAQNFMLSAEFQSLYPSTDSERDNIRKFYANVLDRQADDAGVDYWMSAREHGASMSDVLVAISESAEHQALLVGQMTHGVTYIPFA